MPPVAREPQLAPGQLRNWRTSLKLTQAQAANLLGISLRQYTNLENGHTPISKPIVLSCALVDFLAVKIHSFEELRAKLDSLKQDVTELRDLDRC